jgi:hypothetical protein
MLFRLYKAEASLRMFCKVSGCSQCHTVSSIYASGGIVIVVGGVFEIMSSGEDDEILRKKSLYF